MWITANERLFIAGRTGSGKTFLSERLAREANRLLVIDPKGSLRGRFGTHEWTSQQRQALSRGDPLRARIPIPPGADSSYLEEVFELAYHAGNVYVYIDELYGVVPPGAKPGVWLSALYTRGRERRIGVWTGTQRPTWIPLFAISESDWFFVFRLLLDEDRKRLGMIHPQLAVPVRDRHGFWLYNTLWDTPQYLSGVLP